MDSEVVYQLVFGFEGLQLARTLLPEARVVRLAERGRQRGHIITLLAIARSVLSMWIMSYEKI